MLRLIENSPNLKLFFQAVKSFFHHRTPLSSPLNKGRGPSFEQTWITFTDADALCQV